MEEKAQNKEMSDGGSTRFEVEEKRVRTLISTKSKQCWHKLGWADP
jgi:hypothetical protein